MGKRIDECLFCKSRKCYQRIYRHEEPKYDEISCDKHYEDLKRHCDEILGVNNGVMRIYCTGSARHKRGEDSGYERNLRKLRELEDKQCK